MQLQYHTQNTLQIEPYNYSTIHTYYTEHIVNCTIHLKTQLNFQIFTRYQCSIMYTIILASNQNKIPKRKFRKTSNENIC